MTSDPTRALTTAIASGDPEAFAAFYDAWFEIAYAEARRLTRRDESFCLDVVQDAMMKVIRSMRPINGRGQLHRWFLLVIRSVAYDRLRREIRRSAREHAVSGVSEHVDQAPEEHLRWLRQEIEALDEADATLLIMRHRFGWTLDRIGAALGLSGSAVDGRLRRVLAGLSSRATKEVLDD